MGGTRHGEKPRTGDALRDGRLDVSVGEVQRNSSNFGVYSEALDQLTLQRAVRPERFRRWALGLCGNTLFAQ
jgi:hypothetical protein